MGWSDALTRKEQTLAMLPLCHSIWTQVELSVCLQCESLYQNSFIPLLRSEDSVCRCKSDMTTEEEPRFHFIFIDNYIICSQL